MNVNPIKQTISFLKLFILFIFTKQLNLDPFKF
jgi:hypothetical protein